jgi:hypothetical protein
MAATHVAYVSQIGQIMRARGLSVDDLRTRLAQRGVRVSRMALDRLISPEPVRAVRLAILLPVLEELGTDLGAAYTRAEMSEAGSASSPATRKQPSGDREQPVRGRAGTRQSQVAAADRELAEMTVAARDRLREQQPDMFDSRGRLRRRVLAQRLAERTGGKAALGKAEVLALARADSPRPRSHDTPR